MDTEDKRACRLCLKLIHNNFTPVDKLITQMLDVLILKPNLEISPEPVMCSECEKNLQKSFDLKMVFQKNYSKLISITKHDETNEQSVNISKDHKIECQVCMNLVIPENLVQLFETKENVFLMHTLKKHIPELNSIDSEQFLTCEYCVEDFQTVFNFIWKCSDAEDEIKKYVKMEGIEIKDQIELCDVQKFTVIPVLKDEISSDDVNDVGLQQMIDEKMEITIEQEIKTEDMIEIDIPALKVKIEVDAEIKPIDNDRCLDAAAFKHKCDKCTYQTNNKYLLKKHMIVHKDASKVKWHKCMQCPFQTKRKESLTTHSLVHKIPSEVKMYQCDKCSYGTKYKANLIKHVVIHKKDSELTTYKCDECTFETKHVNSMYGHKMIHKKDHSIVYQCDECIFMTYNKYNMKTHMLRHRGLAKSKSGQKFSCEICSVEFKTKGTLKLHLTIHGSTSKETVFKCTLCSFRSKFEQKLKQHIVYHENPSEVTMYKCDNCSFESMYKYNLRNHINIKHLRNMHKCKFCPYETLYRSSLMNHQIKHKYPSEVVMNKCDWCLYKSNKKSTLKNHMLTHRIYNPIYKNAYD